jgi:thiol-disulfide isomerase/thioredoxin
MAAPVLRVASFDGTPVTIGGDGKATLVVFLAHWCPHCQRELPVLARWLEDGRLPSSVSLYLVSTAASRERPNWPPSAWLRVVGLNVPVLAADRQSSAAAYGLSASRSSPPSTSTARWSRAAAASWLLPARPARRPPGGRALARTQALRRAARRPPIVAGVLQSPDGPVTTGPPVAGRALERGLRARGRVVGSYRAPHYSSRW